MFSMVFTYELQPLFFFTHVITASGMKVQVVTVGEVASVKSFDMYYIYIYIIIIIIINYYYYYVIYIY